MNPTATNPRAVSRRLSLIFTALGCSGGVAFAASNSWIAGSNGNYADAANWTGGVNVPNGAADNATSDGVGSVIAFNDTVTLNALTLNGGSGATVFNQSGGSLALNTLGFGGAGGSRNPTYHLSGGTLSMSAFTWGNGTNARFNVSGGAASYSGAAITIGVAGGANGAITVSSGSFSHSGTGQLQLGTASNGTGGILMTGGTFSTNSNQFRIGAQGGGSGNITLSGSAIFNANGTGTANIYLGNNGGSGNLTLGDTAQFNAGQYVLSVGQFGNTAGNKGTLTMAGSATLSADRIVLGGDNTASAITGIVTLNGGTVSTGSIRLGSSNVAASATANVIHANGGTVKAVTHANNANFFQGAFVNLQAGGLKLDTNGNAVGISNAMSGSGGLTKQGSGTLTLTGANSYAGTTEVKAGTLHLGEGAALAGAVTVDAGATLAGFGTIGGSTTIAGTHAVGASPGLQTFSSGLEYLSTGVLAWELVANSEADRGLTTGHDALDVTGGAVTVNSGATLDLVFNAAGSAVDFTEGFWASDRSWKVIDLSGSATDGGGAFTLGSVTLDANAVSSAGYGGFSVSKTEGDHYLVWTAVPEPGAALLGSLGLLALLRRRRA